MKKNTFMPILFFMIAGAGCGIKGPPLPPLEIAPPALTKTDEVIPAQKAEPIKKPQKTKKIVK